MANNKKIGLYFGTFNPIHIGHLIIANHMVNYTDLDEVWFVVSPLNPFKNKKILLDNYVRLEFVNRAIEGYDKLKVSDIEFGLPRPSYTINTLVYIDEKVFLDLGIEVIWFEYAGYPFYPQLWGEFTHGVTILDLLFNCGKDSPRYMRYVA